jgi:RimJ/RimL family protein N-acetyltransferase
VDLEAEWRATYRIPLETPRLLLRPLIPTDAQWLAALFADPDACRYLWEPACSPEQAVKYADAVISLDQQRHRFGRWAIQDRASDQATAEIHGWVELDKLRPYIGPSDYIALSYVLRPASWGQGIATEAAARLLRHAFDALQLDCLMAVTMSANKASQRVLEKIGMRPFRNSRTPTGHRVRFFRIDPPADLRLLTPASHFEPPPP